MPARIVGRNLLPLPAGLAPELAAMCEPYACAIRTAERSGAGPGDVVAVLGGGVQGQLLTATLAAAGADAVLFDPHAERRERALRFGAREALDAPRDAAAAADARRALPGGGGADVVIEAVGRPEAWEGGPSRWARRGRRRRLFHGRLARRSKHGHAPRRRGRTNDELPPLQGSYHHTPDPRAPRARGAGRGSASLLTGERWARPWGSRRSPRCSESRGARSAPSWPDGAQATKPPRRSAPCRRRPVSSGAAPTSRASSAAGSR